MQRNAPVQRAPRPARPTLPSLVGGSYFPVSALARLPLSMLTISVLTYLVAVADLTTAGAVTALAGIGTAIGAPIMGAASDRWGQRPTLLVVAPAYIAALVWVLVVGKEADSTTQLICAALAAGILAPQAGPMTRVRWIRRLGGRGPSETAALDAAQSYESTMDELSFVFGPAVVGLLAAVASPSVPLWTAMVLTAVVIPWFALHPSADAARPHRNPVQVGADGEPTTSAIKAPQERVPYLLTGVLLLGMLCIGTIFGSLVTASTAFAEATGHDGAGGLVYATMGLTSGFAALSVSRWSPRFTTSRRWIVCAAVLVPALALLWLPTLPWQLAVLLLLVGAPVGPVLVTVFTIAARHTPARRLGLVMTLLSSGITLGTSIGSSVGGILADAGGHSAVLWVSLIAGILLLVVGLVQAPLSARADSATKANGARVGNSDSGKVS